MQYQSTYWDMNRYNEITAVVFFFYCIQLIVIYLKYCVISYL